MLRRWIIEKLGGYPDFDAVIESIKDKDSAERNVILTLAVKRLYNTIGPDDILKIHEHGEMIFQGRHLSAGEVEMLQAEAKQFYKSRLWKVLQAELQYQANKKLYLDSRSENDIVAGKLWKFTIDAINTRVKKLMPNE